MGKGANVQISNACSWTTPYVSFGSFHCMYNNGTDGSDFGPISGQLKMPGSLPATGTQYIEAINSGSCYQEGGRFILTVSDIYSSVSFSLTAQTSVLSSGGGYSVEGGSFSVQEDNGLKVSVTIASNGVAGDQDVILVVVHDTPELP